MSEQKIPPMVAVNRNVDDGGPPTVSALGYDVYSWSPGLAGEGVPSTQVHLALPVCVPGTERVELTVTLRLKSARALDELVGVLLQHRKDVWG